jgi:antitoxin HicB
MRYAYPVDILEAPDGVTITCRDVPELVTEGTTAAEALEHAQDALVSALSLYVDDGRPIPLASDARGRPVVRPPVLEAAKFALHDAMLAAGITNMELGRRTGLDEKQVRRLRDPLHRSHIGAIETAIRSLGLEFELSVGDAATPL